MAKNPCGKTVTPEHAYEVWASADETWLWFVLKKYKSPESEAKDPFARYSCAVQSPMTNGRFEYGDVYVAEVKNGNHRIVNPLQPLTDAAIAELWQLLRDVPMSEQETLDTAFYLWPKGTARFKIWQWFDKQYSGGLEALHRVVQTTGGHDESATSR